MLTKYVKYYLLLISLLSNTICFGQQNAVDSLLKVLPETTDTTRFNVLSKLFWSTFNTNPQQAKTYIDEERQLARKLEDELYIGRSYNDLGVYYWTQSQLDSSINSFKNALSIFEKIQNIYRENATLNNLGNLYADKGDFEEAADYYMKSIKIKEELNDREGMAIGYNNLANIYTETENLDLALQYYDKGLEIAIALHDSARISDGYSGKAILFNSLENYHESIRYNLKALAINRKLGNQYLTAMNMGNIGQSYSKLANYDSSLYYFNQAMKINSEMGNRLALSINYRGLGNSYAKKEMLGQALNYLNKSLAISTEINAKKEVLNTYASLSEAYEHLGDFHRALDFYKKYKNLEDSVLSEETKLKINDLEISYQTEKKEKEIAQQNLEIQTLLKEALIQDFRKNWLIAGLCVAIALGGLIFYSQKQRLRRQKLESENRQMEIENELTVKKKELATHTLHLVQKNDLLDDLNSKLKEIKKAANVDKSEISRLIQKIKNDKVADKDWENFKLYFDQVHEDFDTKLKQYFNDLTSNEIRLAALMKMKLSTKEIASILNISADSVNKARYRLRKKLNMNSDDRLEDFILAL